MCRESSRNHELLLQAAAATAAVLNKRPAASYGHAQKRTAGSRQSCVMVVGGGMCGMCSGRLKGRRMSEDGGGREGGGGLARRRRMDDG